MMLFLLIYYCLGWCGVFMFMYTARHVQQAKHRELSLWKLLYYILLPFPFCVYEFIGFCAHYKWPTFIVWRYQTPEQRRTT